jgi:hypothetical protein
VPERACGFDSHPPHLGRHGVRSRAEVDRVLELVSGGRNQCEISRETGIPRATVPQLGERPHPRWRASRRGPMLSLRDRAGSVPGVDRARLRVPPRPLPRRRMPPSSRTRPSPKYFPRRGLSRDRGRGGSGHEPRHAGEQTVGATTSASRIRRVNSYSKHWPCLFPQHGPGMKHQRRIALEKWQRRICDLYPHRLLRGAHPFRWLPLAEHDPASAQVLRLSPLPVLQPLRRHPGDLL